MNSQQEIRLLIRVNMLHVPPHQFRHFAGRNRIYENATSSLLRDMWDLLSRTIFCGSTDSVLWYLRVEDFEKSCVTDSWFANPPSEQLWQVPSPA